MGTLIRTMVGATPTATSRWEVRAVLRQVQVRDKSEWPKRLGETTSEGIKKEILPMIRSRGSRLPRIPSSPTFVPPPPPHPSNSSCSLLIFTTNRVYNAPTRLWGKQRPMGPSPSNHPQLWSAITTSHT